MTYNTQQRVEHILSQVYQQGHVTVKGLATEMAVSEATVRRDLRTLADGGQIELVYGGAALARNADYSFRSKSVRNVQPKRIIGKLATELIDDGEQIFVDSGTTCFEMIALLKRKRELSVIASSARIAMELANATGPNVIMLGGQYRPERMDSVGPLAASTLDQLRGYLAFIGADGLSMDFGLTASLIDSAQIYNLAIRNARESIPLGDHTKFLAPSLFKIVDWDAISRLVTDKEPLPQWMKFFDSLGIEVLYPKNNSNNNQTGVQVDAKECSS